MHSIVLLLGKFEKSRKLNLKSDSLWLDLGDTVVLCTPKITEDHLVALLVIIAVIYQSLMAALRLSIGAHPR